MRITNNFTIHTSDARIELPGEGRRQRGPHRSLESAHGEYVSAQHNILTSNANLRSTKYMFAHGSKRSPHGGATRSDLGTNIRLGTFRYKYTVVRSEQGGNLHAYRRLLSANDVVLGDELTHKLNISLHNKISMQKRTNLKCGGTNTADT